MRSIRTIALALVLGVLLRPPASLRAAVTPGDSPGDVPAIGSLAGQLLVAAPDMPDPRFAHTVVLIVRHDKNGAFGIVINRPVEEQPLARLLKALGDADTDVEGNVLLFAGGPVETSLGFVVHSAEYHRAETMAIDGHVAVTADAEILRDIAHHKGPKKSLVAFGYAGWGPGQLDEEMAQRGWFTAPADPALIFDEDRRKVWDAAMARRTINL